MAEFNVNESNFGNTVDNEAKFKEGLSNKMEENTSFLKNEGSSISGSNLPDSVVKDAKSCSENLDMDKPGSSKIADSNNLDSNFDSEPSTSKEEEEWLDILGSGHLKKKVLVKGKEDSRPHRGETVILDIVGKLDDGTEFEKLDDIEVTIGDAEVVQGLEYALPLMDEGETAEVFVKPRFGYGSLGDLPRVPKDANLTYIVTIKQIIELKDVNEYTLDERLRVGRKKKDRGNWLYQRKEYNLAIQCYRKALIYFEQDIPESNNELDEEIVKTYNNLSVAHFNLEAFDAALTSVDKVLKQQPDNIKAVYRKVKILKAQGEIEDAIGLAKKGLKAKPDSPALQDELNLLIEMKKKSTQAQKEIYRKMFQLDNNKKDDKSSFMKYSWKVLGVLTVAVGIIGAAAIKYKF